MNWPRQVAGVSVFLLLVPIILGGLSVSGCKSATQVIVEPDPRVFTLFAGLVAVGYGEGQADPSFESLRTQLKEALADWTPDDLYPMTRLEENYRPDQLVAATLKLGPPPDFSSDGQSLVGLQHFLVTVWKDVEPLYKTNSAAESRELATMAGPAEAAIQRAIDYARGGAPYKAWRVVPEALALPGCAYGYRDESGRTVWVIVGRPPGSWERDLAREAFRVVMHDELAGLETEGDLGRFEPVLERARFVPAVRERYPEEMPVPGMPGYVEENVDALLEYVEENLVLAVTARTVDSANGEAAVGEAAKSGFFLAPGLSKGLANYEASGKTLTGYLGTLLEGADVQAALALAPAYTWEKVSLPWWYGWTREAWLLTVSVPGKLRAELTGEATNFPPIEGLPVVSGWGTEEWGLFTTDQTITCLPDWSGVAIPAGGRIWIVERDSLTGPNEPPPLEFVPE